MNTDSYPWQEEMRMSAEYKTVNLAAMGSGDRAAETAAIEAATRAFCERGLAHCSGHGITRKEARQFYLAWWRVVQRLQRDSAFFALYSTPEIAFQRGFAGPGAEDNDASRRAGSSRADEKWMSYYHTTSGGGPSALMQQLFPMMMGANNWPTEPEFAEFVRLYKRLGRKMYRAARTFLRALAQGLGLPKNAFINIISGGMHGGRGIFYPDLTERDIAEGTFWAANHTDCNFITILLWGLFRSILGEFQWGSPDGTGGLFQWTKEGERISGLAPEDCIPMQAGQALEVATAGAVVATQHEVLPPGLAGWMRFMLTLFVHPHPLWRMRPHTKFRTGDWQERYDMQCFSVQFMQATLRNIGLISPGTLAAQLLALRDHSAAPSAVHRSDVLWVYEGAEEVLRAGNTPEAEAVLRDRLIYRGHSDLVVTTGLAT